MFGHQNFKEKTMNTHNRPKDHQLYQNKYQQSSFVQQFWYQNNRVQIEQQYPKHFCDGIQIKNVNINQPCWPSIVTFMGKNYRQQKKDGPRRNMKEYFLVIFW